jgi:hypothetical protein
MTSNREKRKIAREGALKLKGTDWDPSTFRAKDPLEKLQELAAAEAGGMSATVDCEACRRERERLGDETALCAEHLAKAMGF